MLLFIECYWLLTLQAYSTLTWHSISHGSNWEVLASGVCKWFVTLLGQMFNWLYKSPDLYFSSSSVTNNSQNCVCPISLVLLVTLKFYWMELLSWLGCLFAWENNQKIKNKKTENNCVIVSHWDFRVPGYQYHNFCLNSDNTIF